MSMPAQTTRSTKDERLETVTAQFWKEDLAQLLQLSAAGGDRESVAHLRRIALHIGTQVLSLSTRALLSPSEPIGLYTAEEIAKDLLPRLDPATQTLARIGYPVHPYPVGIDTLLEMLARLGYSGIPAELTRRIVQPDEQSSSRREQQVGEPSDTASDVSGQRVVPSQEARKRLNLEEEGTV